MPARIVAGATVLIAFLALASNWGPAGVTATRLSASLAPTFHRLTQLQQQLLGYPIPATARYRILPVCNKRQTASVGPGDWTCTMNVYIVLAAGQQPLTNTPVAYDVSVQSNGCYKASSPPAYVGGASCGTRGTRRQPAHVLNGCCNVLSPSLAHVRRLIAAPRGVSISRRPRRYGMNSTTDVAGRTAMVVGASRGLGRGIALALAEARAEVIAVARTPGTDSAMHHEEADATDATAPGSLLDRYDPSVLVIVAGATPLMRPLQQHTWETFSINWETDVRIAFHWLREALLRPLPPGSRVIVLSSGAALRGSPLSGGYAGAKATERFITAYAQDEADRAELGITFTTVLPRLTPLTDLGRPAVRAYAARAGQSEEEYLQRFGEPVSPDVAGRAVVELTRTNATDLAPDYLLTGAGLQTL